MSLSTFKQRKQKVYAVCSLGVHTYVTWMPTYKFIFVLKLKIFVFDSKCELKKIFIFVFNVIDALKLKNEPTKLPIGLVYILEEEWYPT